MMDKKILVIGAHPDDETYGMGGTIARYCSNNDIVHVLIITDGSSSQYENYEEMIERKKNETRNAMDILGLKNIEFNMLPDMKIDTIPHVKINSIIEKKIADFKPDIVYTHFWGDANKDHRLVFESTIVAIRPTSDQSVKKVYSYEIPSSTEWQAPISDLQFHPTSYIDISDFLDKKIRAIECFKSEIKPFPHPRSPEAVKIYNKRTGNSICILAAERFFLLREII